VGFESFGDCCCCCWVRLREERGGSMSRRRSAAASSGEENERERQREMKEAVAGGGWWCGLSKVLRWVRKVGLEILVDTSWIPQIPKPIPHTPNGKSLQIKVPKFLLTGSIILYLSLSCKHIY
jgi:hypothetical protein